MRLHGKRQRGFTVRQIIKSLYCFNDGGTEGGGSGGTEGGTDTGTGGEASASYQMAGNSSEPAVPNFVDVVPGEYRERPWVQNILRSEKPQEEFFKQFENAQKLIGQRAPGIPGENATEEEIRNFHKAIGVPESPDGYDLKDTEWGEDEKHIADIIKETRGSDEFQKEVKAIFHKHGLTPKQAQGLLQDYDKAFAKHNADFFKQASEAKAAADADFDTKAAEIFGDRMDKVLEDGKALLGATMDERLRSDLASLDNKALMVLASALDGVRTKYIKEDSFGNTGNTGGANSMDSIRAEGQRLMALPAYTDPLHKDHETVMRQVKANYEKLKNTSK